MNAAGSRPILFAVMGEGGQIWGEADKLYFKPIGMDVPAVTEYLGWDYARTFTAEISHFVDAIAKGYEPLNSVAEATATLRVIYGSLRRHGLQPHRHVVTRSSESKGRRRVYRAALSISRFSREGHMTTSDGLLLGVDLGTSSVKVVFVTADGQTWAHGSAAYPILQPQPGYAEQDPQAWWQAVCQAVRMAASSLEAAPHVAAIGLSGQMHGTVLLGAQGDILAPAIIWPDQRSIEQVQEITAQIGLARLTALTGSPVATGFQAATLLWARQQRPELWRRIAHVLLPKDYVRWRITGEFATDASDGSGALLLDVQRRAWSPELRDAAGPRRGLAAAGAAIERDCRRTLGAGRGGVGLGGGRAGGGGRGRYAVQRPGRRRGGAGHAAPHPQQRRTTLATAGRAARRHAGPHPHVLQCAGAGHGRGLVSDGRHPGRGAGPAMAAR